MAFEGAPQPDDREHVLLFKIARGIYQYVAGGIATIARQYTASSAATVQTAEGNIATLAAGQKLRIQNLDVDELIVKYGTGASTSSFTFIIPACTAEDDGTVPPYDIDDWVGIVSVKSASGTPRYLATILSA